MIKLTRLNNSEIILNSDLIEHIELTTDTVITLTNGNAFVVKEHWEEILERIISFRRRVVNHPLVTIAGRETD
jgi:flagellar protein FlbD